MDSSHTGTPPKYEKDDDESDVDLTIFDLEHDESNFDISIFYSGDDKSSDPDDCCHHIENVRTSIQIFSIFITSLIITN
jgi:hypothetical protein